MAVPSFLFGGSTGETPSSIRQKRDLVRALMGASNAPKNIGEGLNALGDGIVANVLDRRANRAEEAGQATANSLFNSILGSPSTPGATGSAMPAVSPSGDVPVASSQPGEVYSPFIDTVKASINNPYGLAAVAATGQAESGFSPKNAGRTWNDGANNAGGIMSWNGPRLANLQKFAGGTNGTPEQQAQFFLQENPDLVAKLNNAKSVEEAQRLMNNAWAFKGYNQPGNPNAAHRLSLANSFLPRFQGQGGGQEVASLDPTAGMTAEAPIQPPPVSPAAPSPTPGYVDPRISTEGRAPMQGPTQPAPQLPAPTTIASAPPVASVAPQPPVAPPQPQQMAQNAPQQQGGQFAGVDPRLLQALQNPWLNDGQKQAVQILIQQQMQAGQQQQEEQTWRAREDYKLNSQKADPSYQLEQDYKRAQLEALKAKTGKRANVTNLGDGWLYDQDTHEAFRPQDEAAKAGGGSGFRFGGNSVEAQSLNGLIESGQITEGQAQQLGAGKTITDPSTGSMMFLTPQGIFKQQQGQQAAPMDQSQSPINLFGDSGPNAAAPSAAPPMQTALGQTQNAPVPQANDSVSSGNPGIIPLTGGKPQKLLSEAERKNQSLFTVIKPELKVVEDNFDALTDPSNQVYSKMPFSEWKTTPAYQQAANSLQTIISSYLYSVSGATATPEEVRKQTEMLTPRPLESKESIANKKQRIRTMVNAVAQAGSLPPMEEPAAAPPPPEDLSSMPVPDGMDANVWKFVPPEDRKLWLKK
jgi:hypothetical protein